MKNKWKKVLCFLFVGIAISVAQNKNSFNWNNDSHKDDVVMTWNKTTPESEMKDDINALSNKGITIKYNDVKRNSKGEIIAIKVEYADRKGNKGSLEYDNQKPISTIKFFKSGDEIGFGEPNSNDMLANSYGFNNFNKGQNFGNPFNFNNDDNGLGNSKSYSFNFNDDGSSSKSRIIIQKDGKKPLVIEDGEVVQGGEDYSKEEIEEIKKNNKVESYGGIKNSPFGFNSQGNNFNNIQEEMKKMQEQLNQLMPKNNFSEPKIDTPKSDLDETKEEMQKAKEEMLKAKKEMEEAKKELEKAKSSLKMQKA